MLKKPKISRKYSLFIFVSLGILVLFFLIFYQNRNGDYSVEITSPLETIVQPIHKNQIISINGINGIVVVQIEDRRVRVLSSKCPDQICVKAGEIKSPGPMIICAPNRVMVRIIKNNFQTLVTY
jgi:hypothetical protein